MTPNVYDALQFLRKEEGDEQDLVERGEQVVLMKHVYRGAHESIVWLGGRTEDAATIEYALTCLKRQYDKVAQEMGTEEFKSCNNEWWDDYDTSSGAPNHIGFGTELPPVDSDAWDRLASFFSLPWFTRVWVVQEYSLSQAPAFVYGEHYLSGRLVSCAGYWIAWQSMGSVLNRPGLHSSRYIIYLTSHGAGENELFSIMNPMRVFQATDPRDKIYTLQGVALEYSKNQTLPDKLVPNYRLSVQEVYRDATMHFIKVHGIREVLPVIQHEHNHGVDFPLWVVSRGGTFPS